MSIRSRVKEMLGGMLPRRVRDPLERLEYQPAASEPLAVSRASTGTPLRVGVPFDVLSWNLQYSASRRHHFFYDGGTTVRVPHCDVIETLAALQGALRDFSPDLALLQEIDRDSARTHHIDQLIDLQAALGPVDTTSAPYHRSFFVPHPLPRALGRVEMHLGILSRAPLGQAQRLQLPLLDEPRLRQIFNLKRALVTTTIALDGSPHPLHVAVTHLSAFSYGDGTLEKQVAQLRSWMQAHDPNVPWILAGDLNLLPPGDDKQRLPPNERELYADEPSPITALIPEFREVFSDLLAPENRSYLPFGATEPDRKLDYLFVGGPIEVLSARVDRAYLQLSDHLPLLATLRIQAPG